MSKRTGWAAIALITATIFYLSALARNWADAMEPTPTPYPTRGERLVFLPVVMRETVVVTATPTPTKPRPTPEPATPTATPTATPIPPWPGKGVGATYYPDFCAQARKMGATWAYNWGPVPGIKSVQGHRQGDACEGVAFVAARAHYANSCPKLWPGQYLLALNEPVTQYRKSIRTSAGDLGGMHECHPDRDFVILSEADIGAAQSILDQYVEWYGPVPSNWRLGIHIYGQYTVERGMDYARRMVDEWVNLAKKYGMAGVWVTEYALWHAESQEQAAEFVRQAHALFRDHPYVERAAPFQLWMQDTEPWAWGEQWSTKLVNDDGSLTLIGEAYRDGS